MLRINMRTKQIDCREAPLRYLQSGGRALIARVLQEEIPPQCEPLGRENKLVIATGLLTGGTVSNANRLSIGAKSPLTGGIKESNAGGIFAMRLANQGIKLLIIEDIPEEDTWYYLRIDCNGCEIVRADAYRGMGTVDFFQAMRQTYPEAAISGIGPAGEYAYKLAGIAVSDLEGRPNRYCGRGGLGAVMGAKKIKGLIIPDKGTPPVIRDPKKYQEAVREYTRAVIDAPSTVSYRTLGTAAMVQTTNEMTGLPTRNFHGQKFAGADTLSGQALHALIQERGGVGKTSHACMPGCVIRCSNVVPDREGAYVTAGLEYETIALTGSNLCIDDLDTVAKINAACNDIGIDTIETGAVIGVAMEAGLLPFGDGDGVLKLLEEIRNHTEIGKLLGEGTYRAGKHWGVKHLPVINKQAFPAYDPRTVVPMGITYATSPMGADHTYGPGLHAQDPVEQTRQSQRLLAKIDSLGICMFARVPVKDRLHLFVDMINARYGWDLTEDWLDRLAEETLRNEQDFNQKAGFTKEDYRMPDAFTKTGIPATGQVFSIDPDQLDQLRQWDD